MKKFLFILGLLIPLLVNSQGRNHQWLLGSYINFPDPKGRMLIDSSGYNLIYENRKMVFQGTQGNISDEQGNLLMASNGIWIMDATGDTMQNGSKINPNGITNDWPFGLPMAANNTIVPQPGNNDKFIMVHHTYTNIGTKSKVFELYWSGIDMSLNGGLGGIYSKNNVLIQDTMNGGIAMVKHANGRDWWVIMNKDSTSIMLKALLTPTGFVNYPPQNLNYNPVSRGSTNQMTFSNEGNRFITAATGAGVLSYIVMADFDRCTGMFSNTQTRLLQTGDFIFGLAFSPSGQYAYACSREKVFQVNMDTYTVDTVAYYDLFISPPTHTCCANSFWNMYQAANGKIYISSGSGVQHIHEMNYPDSAGVACDLQQHAIDLLTYRYLRAVPHHPNYYLGAVTGCVCDSLGVGIQELQAHDFRMSVSPNPSNGNFRMMYLLPQNQGGLLEVYDVNGRRVYTLQLPPWSTLQEVELPSELAGGVYSCVITSGGQRVAKKVVLLR